MTDLPMVPELKWISREESIYKMRVLDVRSFTTTMVSTPSDKKQAESFQALRKSQGAQLVGKTPDETSHVECQLLFPHAGATRDGALMLARELEDKWDIFLLDGFLYFTRSWSGILVYRAKIDFWDTQAIVSSIDAIGQNVRAGSWLAISAVDFLIKSHLYRREAPHTVPPNIPNDDMGIAAYSFQEYGRWASYASFEDTTRVSISSCPHRG